MSSEYQLELVRQLLQNAQYGNISGPEISGPEFFKKYYAPVKEFYDEILFLKKLNVTIQKAVFDKYLSKIHELYQTFREKLLKQKTDTNYKIYGIPRPTDLIIKFEQLFESLATPQWRVKKITQDIFQNVFDLAQKHEKEVMQHGDRIFSSKK